MMLCNFNIQTARVKEARKHEVLVVERKIRKCYIIDFSCTNDETIIVRSAVNIENDRV